MADMTLRLGLDVGGVVSKKLRRRDLAMDKYVDDGFLDFYHKFAKKYGADNVFVGASCSFHDLEIR